MSGAPNTLKWDSINNAVAALTAYPRVCLERHGDDETLDSDTTTKLRQALEGTRALLFEHPVVSCTVKVDGTNVGIDATGAVYGRNQMADPSATKYMKTDLTLLKSVDVSAIQGQLESLGGLPGILDRFVLYGELTCNKSLYDYACDGGMQTWSCFGAMIKLTEGADEDTFRANLAGAGLLLAAPDESEPPGGDYRYLMLHANDDFKQLFPDVPYVPQQKMSKDTTTTFADLVFDDETYGIVATGRQEGFVVILQDPSTKAGLALKWKNGGEAPGDSVKNILAVEELLASPNENLKAIREAVFSASQLQVLPALLSRLKKVYDNTERVDLNADGSVKQAKKPSQEKKPATAKVIPAKVYADAIKSARTKFDHVDTFLEKGEGGREDYISLITAECTQDVVDTLGVSAEERESAAWLASHREEVRRMLAMDKRFSAAGRAAGGGGGGGDFF